MIISALGVSPNMPYRLQKRIMLSNRFSFIYSLAILAGAGIFAFAGYSFSTFALIVIALHATVTLLLNKYHKTALSRLSFCLIQPVIFVFSSVFVKLHESIGFDVFTYHFPGFALMCWVILPLILFDIQQKYHIIPCIGLISLSMFIFDPLHQLFGAIPTSIDIASIGHTLINITQRISLTLFTFGFVLLQKINTKYERKIEVLLDDVHRTNEELEESSAFLEEAMEELMASNNEVHLQKQQIEIQNDYLTDVNKELVKAKHEIEEKNQQLQTYNEKLEQEVEERTLRLMITNNQLVSASRELDTFIYRASHDLMGPIVTLKGLSNLALIDKENTWQYLDRFKSNIDTMHYRLSQLLQMLSIKDTEVNLKKINLHMIMQNAFNNLNPSEAYPNIMIKCNIPTDLSLISDEDMLQLALEHIIRNALQYSKKASMTAWVSIEVVSDEFTICIHIRDNGIGISQETGPRIFDMFYRGTEQSKGAGLGLYVSKKAVERLNGDIAWESGQGQTTFSILLAQKAEIIEHHQEETVGEYISECDVRQ